MILAADTRPFALDPCMVGMNIAFKRPETRGTCRTTFGDPQSLISLLVTNRGKSGAEKKGVSEGENGVSTNGLGAHQTSGAFLLLSGWRRLHQAFVASVKRASMALTVFLNCSL